MFGVSFVFFLIGLLDSKITSDSDRAYKSYNSKKRNLHSKYDIDIDIDIRIDNNNRKILQCFQTIIDLIFVYLPGQCLQLSPTGENLASAGNGEGWKPLPHCHIQYISGHFYILSLSDPIPIIAWPSQ